MSNNKSKKKQQRLNHNKKTSPNKPNSASKKTKLPASSTRRANRADVDAFLNSSEGQDFDRKQIITEKDLKQAQKTVYAKKKDKATTDFKRVFTIVVCSILVLAFAIPSGVALFASNNPTPETEEEEFEPTISREGANLLKDLGRFDNFLVVDKDNGITITDLYDTYTTAEEQAILNRLEAEGITAADLLDNDYDEDADTSSTTNNTTDNTNENTEDSNGIVDENQETNAEPIASDTDELLQNE